MALPALTPQQRADALAKAAEARRARARLMSELGSGQVSLADILERASQDEVIAKTHVLRLLKALPGIGETRANAAMEAVGIARTRRVAGLGPRQREQLVKHFH